MHNSRYLITIDPSHLKNVFGKGEIKFPASVPVHVYQTCADLLCHIECCSLIFFYTGYCFGRMGIQIVSSESGAVLLYFSPNTSKCGR